jgi:DNA-binding SARP family transcriptional activator
VSVAGGAFSSLSPPIGVLGSIVVVREGVPVALTSAHQRLLLAILVAGDGRVVSTDELVEALWGDDLPTDPAAALQTQVSRLRRSLGPAAAWLQTVGTTGYRLTVDPEQVDAARFAQLVERARDARGGPAAALGGLRAALRRFGELTVRQVRILCSAALQQAACFGNARARSSLGAPLSCAACSPREAGGR